MNKTFRVSKALLLATSLMFILSAAIYGTMAWLADESEPVINTFTYGDINITLEETDTNTDGDNNPNTNEYHMMPGENITKDPLVTVKANSENTWLFVKLEKSGGCTVTNPDNSTTAYGFDDFIEYTVILDDPATPAVEGWTALDGVDGVYYRAVDKADTDTSFGVIANDTVTVKATVTKEMLNALDAGGTSNYPKLTITAYAVQRAGFATAADAWAQVTGNTTP